MLAQVNLQDHLTGAEFGVVFHLTHPTVSRHLKALWKAGLLVGKRYGNWMCYFTSGGIDRMLPLLVGEDQTRPFRKEDRAPTGTIGLHPQ